MTVDNCQTPSVPEPQRDGGMRSMTERDIDFSCHLCYNISGTFSTRRAPYTVAVASPLGNADSFLPSLTIEGR